MLREWLTIAVVMTGIGVLAAVSFHQAVMTLIWLMS